MTSAPHGDFQPSGAGKSDCLDDILLGCDLHDQLWVARRRQPVPDQLAPETLVLRVSWGCHLSLDTALQFPYFHSDIPLERVIDLLVSTQQTGGAWGWRRPVCILEPSLVLPCNRFFKPGIVRGKLQLVHAQIAIRQLGNFL